MKIFTLIVCLVFCSNTAYCHNNHGWIAHNSAPAVVVPPVVEVPTVPTQVYTTYARPLMMMYDWVPYTVNHLVVTERHGLLCKHRTYHYEPRIEWVYQPVWK